jgi:uncharacterized membrane protein
MKKLITRTLAMVLQGIGTLLPLGLTLYALYWLISTLEQLASQLLIPQTAYFPGLGLLAALAILFGTGLLMNLYGVRYLVDMGDRMVQKIPLAKSVYAAIQDIVSVFSLSKKNDLQSVVSVDMGNGISQIGFVTGAATGQRLFPGTDKVGVYLPMSYQIGGFTLYMDRSRLTPLDLGIEEAMRIALTGGTQSNGGAAKHSAS